MEAKWTCGVLMLSLQSVEPAKGGETVICACLSEADGIRLAHYATMPAIGRESVAPLVLEFTKS